MGDPAIERLRAYEPFAPESAWAPAAAGAGGAGGDLDGDAARSAFVAEGLRYLLLDVFTDVPLTGNPLAVFTDGRGVGAERMQRLAGELNLSESVFMLPAQQAGEVRIRIFTPATELAFAGHPTLGAAVVAGAALGRSDVTLETGAGPVAVSLVASDGRAVQGTMAQPLPSIEPFAAEPALLSALGVGRSRMPVELYCNGPRHVLVALSDESEVAALSPDLRALERLGQLCVSCFAGAGGRWTTRMFAPAVGVAEDPATGSAAGPLAVHLARHGQTRFGEEIEIRQGAAIGRPSLLRAVAHGQADRIERVEVTGSAVIVASAEMRL